jgi:hypothetical protein
MNFYRLFLAGALLYVLAYFAPVNMDTAGNLFGGFYLTWLDIIMIVEMVTGSQTNIADFKDVWFAVIIISGFLANVSGFYSIVNGLLCDFKKSFFPMIIAFICWGICLPVYLKVIKIDYDISGFPIAHYLWGAGMCFVICASAKLRNYRDFVRLRDRNLFYIKRLFRLNTPA